MRLTYIYPYHAASRSAKLLAETLGIQRIKRTESRFRGGPRKTVINWGNSVLPAQVRECVVLNKARPVFLATHKDLTFDALAAAGVSIPEYTNSPQVARGWLQTGDVCIRHLTTGHEGNGLRIVSQGDTGAFDIEPAARLYTKYVKKRAEYRIHVMGGAVIHMQQKLRKRNAEGDARIRNTANGYVFTSRNLEVPAAVAEQATAAVAALGLDFGAVDMVWNEYRRRAYVLEVNTAPGVEGVSLERYADALTRLCRRVIIQR